MVNFFIMAAFKVCEEALKLSLHISIKSKGIGMSNSETNVLNLVVSPTSECERIHINPVAI